MLGKKESFYFGAAILFAMMGFVLGYFKPEAQMGFAAILVPICGGLYGGGIGKLWMELKHGNGTN